MKKIISIVLALFLVQTISAQTKYVIDPAKSSIHWLAKKVTGEHNGTVGITSGEFLIDKETVSKGKFEVDMNSIVVSDIKDATYNAKLLGHLKSDDFFSVTANPKATFTFDEAFKLQKGNSTITGKMTIKGIPQPITFKAVFFPTEQGMQVFANITLDRTKFNIRYGSGEFFDNLGDKTIYDDFQLTLNFLAKKN